MARCGARADQGSGKQVASIRSRELDNICDEVDRSEDFVRQWIKNYRRGSYDRAFAAGSSLSAGCPSGRVVAGSTRPEKASQPGRAPTQRQQRQAAAQLTAATCDEAVSVEESGVGGVAARLRGRHQAGHR